MKNPKMMNEEIELKAAGDLNEDLQIHLSAVESVNGASDYSTKMGNKGAHCTLTVECQTICSWL